MEKQPTSPDDTSPPTTNQIKKTIQQIIGIFLYYFLAINPTMLHALSSIAA